jgi:hypothetical protein
MKKESKVISVRITEDEYKMLQSEADNRLLTISELIRVIIDQRQRMGGRQYETRLVRIEEMLNKVLYHALRSDIGHIAQFRMMQGNNLAEKAAKAIKDEYRLYQEHTDEKEKHSK